MSALTQSYFDETVEENEEVFDLSPDDAVTETIEQLFKQQPPNSSMGLDRWKEYQRELGVSLTHPSSKEGEEDRERQRRVQALLSKEDWNEEDMKQLLELLIEDANKLPIASLFWANTTSLTKLFKLTSENEGNLFYCSLQVALKALTVCPKSQRRKCQERLLHDFITPSRGWQRLFLDSNDQSSQILWLQIIYQICQGNEPNKKFNNSKPILETLVKTLETSESNIPLAQAACRVLTVLCRFDDFSSQATQGQATDNTGMVVSSAHSTVTTLGNLNLISILHTWLCNSQEDKELLLVLLQCLRSVAIQNDMVTRMVSVGLMDELQIIFQKYCDFEEPDNNDTRIGILTALIGLYRNLSANDELKTTLCRSSKQSIVGPLIATLQSGNAPTKLQEHVCATLGSMALRQPQNAQRIVQDFQGHVVILKAMESNPTAPLLQRQGALAIRNLASRASEDMKQTLLDAGAEPILRQAAASGGAVDEAYAALRDLGCHAVLLQSNPETGELERQPMFGEKPLQFRPVFD